MTSSEKFITSLRGQIEPLRQEIIHHPVYSGIRDLEDIRVFMNYHVYAVWDFMSLLKALQNRLTCTSVPWYPVGDADTRFLINEIVVGEECDIDIDGERKSHFEMYLDAMRQAGAEWGNIHQLIEQLKAGQSLETAIENSNTPDEAADFIRFTFDIISSGKVHVLAAVFTFGREDLIPEMFVSIIRELHQKFPDAVSRFKYYIDRHIEVDGGHHSHLALRMTNSLCGNDPTRWKEAQEAVTLALKHRKNLWDGTAKQISNASVSNAFVHP